MPSGHEERGAGFASAEEEVRGVRSGVVDDEEEDDDDSADADAVAGAAGADVGALRAVGVVLKKTRVAAAAGGAVRVRGWAVSCRTVAPAARRRHVRQIMVA